MAKKKRFLVKRKFSATRVIAGGFAGAIVIGTFFLVLPISSAEGHMTPLIDAMFTATSAVCVTGLVTLVSAYHWSLFGKVVLLLLMEFGGLGVITMAAAFWIVVRHRLSLKNRLLLMEAYNVNSMQGLLTLTRHIFTGSLLVQGVGALFYAVKLLPEFGILKGIWLSIFTAVSAFCNAGMDLFGADSLAPYRTSFLMNFTTMGLIVIAGLGFPVWWDVLHAVREGRKHHWNLKRMLMQLRLHSKMVLLMTGILIFGGALLILIFEWNNPETLGNQPFGQRIMDALFQSVTTRTAGFYTIDQSKFSNATAFLSVILMFIGGSPAGTAGGVKTVTALVLLLGVVSIVRNRNDVDIFRRKISDFYVKKALSVVAVSMTVLFCAVMLLCCTESAGFMDILYEAASAIGTVGLTRGLTPFLSVPGKLIISLAMYLGRVSPITMAIAFTGKKKNVHNYRTLPEEDVRIG